MNEFLLVVTALDFLNFPFQSNVHLMRLFFILASIFDSPDYMNVARLVMETKKKEKLHVEAEVSFSFFV